MEYIAAVDPGREKCGTRLDVDCGEVIEQRVVPRREALTHLSRGTGVTRSRPSSWATGRDPAFAAGDRGISPLGAWVPISLVEEHLSTLEARERYFTRDRPGVGGG